MDNIDVLSRLVGFKTDGNEKEINRCLKYVQKELNKFGWKTMFVKNEENNKNNLIAVLGANFTNINDGLLLAGHIDTVTTDSSKWKSNPLKLREEDGNLYGLGIADMKCFTAAILSNLEKINQLDIKKPLIFVLTNDEETVMFSIKKVISFMKENKIFPKYAIIGEPSSSSFATSNKGFYEFETIINGKASHSSAPNLGINAIYIMSKLISFIEGLSHLYQKKITTINVGTINGGTMCNVVADKCTIRWDVRTCVKEDLNEIKQKVNQYLNELMNEYAGADFSSDVVFSIPPFEYKTVEQTKRLIQKYNIEENSYSAATEAGFYQELGMDCVIFGCGNIADCHATNEKINKDEYLNYPKMLLEFIKELC